MPTASFIGFCRPPIEQADANTGAVLGDYISVYDIQRAVTDGPTVPIYYESRLVRLELSEEERPRLDPSFEGVTEGQEIARKEKLKSKWAQLEALVGTGKQLKLIARDLVAHYEKRCEAMVVVMSRRIAAELYRELWRFARNGTENRTRRARSRSSSPVRPPTRWSGSRTSATRQGAKCWCSASATRRPRSASSSCATCGSPRLTRPVCIRCTSTSRCTAMG